MDLTPKWISESKLQEFRDSPEVRYPRFLTHLQKSGFDVTQIKRVNADLNQPYMFTGDSILLFLNGTDSNSLGPINAGDLLVIRSGELTGHLIFWRRVSFVLAYKPLSFEQLLERNYKWWSTPGSSHPENPLFGYLGFYDRDEIMEENSDADLLIQVNQKVITLNSQNENYEASPSVFNREYLKNINRPDLEGRMGIEIQRSYLDILTDSATASSIISKLRDSPDIGMHGVNLLDFLNTYNRTYLEELVKFEDSKSLPSIPLTISYVLDGREILVDTSIPFELDNSNAHLLGASLETMTESTNLVYFRLFYKYWGDNKLKTNLPVEYQIDPDVKSYRKLLNVV